MPAPENHVARKLAGRNSRFFLLAAVALASPAFAAVIHVPGDQPTIQAAIDAAVDGDTVLVSPGTYVENINFEGKAITVTSSGGPAVTILDGNMNGTVVTFNSGESSDSVLSGMAVRNGYNVNTNQFQAGGIDIDGASPAIIGNIVRGNWGCYRGGGISVLNGSPVLQGNLIEHNHTPCQTGFGGGLSLEVSSANVQGNRFLGNTASAGAAIGVDGEGDPRIVDNFIVDNIATGIVPVVGGGIWFGLATRGLVMQNLVVGNSATIGGGIYVSGVVPPGPILLNNTIANNPVTDKASALYTIPGAILRIYNNLFIASSGENAVYCDPLGLQPIFLNNDAFSSGGTGWDGSCANEGGKSGNISADPLFADASSGSYQLTAGSPAIDSGDNTPRHPHLPRIDLARQPRVVDGDGDGDAVVDMGAYEYQGP
jgi:hypothetical protein